MKQPSLTDFSPKNILVCQLRQLGDVLLATPSIALLKKRFPTARVDVLTEKKCASLLEHNPDIHTLWLVDKKQQKTFLHDLLFAARVARTGYDLVVDFQQLPRCRTVVALSRAQVRLSYPPPWYTRFLYSHWVAPTPGYSAMYRASLLAPLGINWNGEPPRLHLTREETTRAESWLAAAGVAPEERVVTVDPSHRRATRRWPAAHYGRLLHLLHHHYPNLKFVIMYGPGELNDAREVADAGPVEACIVPDSVLTLREMGGVIARADLHLGNCSAPRHMAVAVDTPTLTVLGATSPGWTFPSQEHMHVRLGLDCQPCNKNSCRKANHPCLRDLTPERVMEEAESFLKNILGLPKKGDN
jgi:heptosyltransferase-2/heptosyltransferase-3